MTTQEHTHTMASRRCWGVQHSARNTVRQHHTPIVFISPASFAAADAGVDPRRAMVSGRCLHLDAFLRDAVDASANISLSHVRDHTRIQLAARSIMCNVHTPNSPRSKRSGISSGASSCSHDEHADGRHANVCSHAFVPPSRPTCLGAKCLKASKEVDMHLLPCPLALSEPASPLPHERQLLERRHG